MNNSYQFEFEEIQLEPADEDLCTDDYSKDGHLNVIPYDFTIDNKSSFFMKKLEEEATETLKATVVEQYQAEKPKGKSQSTQAVSLVEKVLQDHKLSVLDNSAYMRGSVQTAKKKRNHSSKHAEQTEKKNFTSDKNPHILKRSSQKQQYVWYAAYGEDMNDARFQKYLKYTEYTAVGIEKYDLIFATCSITQPSRAYILPKQNSSVFLKLYLIRKTDLYKLAILKNEANFKPNKEAFINVDNLKPSEYTNFTRDSSNTYHLNYNTMLAMGNFENIPIITFTNSIFFHPNANIYSTIAPKAKYLQAILVGLLESFPGYSQDFFLFYLYSKRGVNKVFTIEELAEIRVSEYKVSTLSTQYQTNKDSVAAKESDYSILDQDLSIFVPHHSNIFENDSDTSSVHSLTLNKKNNGDQEDNIFVVNRMKSNLVKRIDERFLACSRSELSENKSTHRSISTTNMGRDASMIIHSNVKSNKFYETDTFSSDLKLKNTVSLCENNYTRNMALENSQRSGIVTPMRQTLKVDTSKKRVPLKDLKNTVLSEFASSVNSSKVDSTSVLGSYRIGMDKKEKKNTSSFVIQKASGDLSESNSQVDISQQLYCHESIVLSPIRLSEEETFVMEDMSCILSGIESKRGSLIAAYMRNTVGLS